MKARVQKWGNSLALRIPKAFAQEVGLEKDREVEMSVEKGRLVVVPPVVPSYTLEELLAGARPSNLHAETDWGTPQGNLVVAWRMSPIRAMRSGSRSIRRRVMNKLAGGLRLSCHLRPTIER
jgi:antitoxin MazE